MSDYSAADARKTTARVKGGATLAQALADIKDRASCGSSQTSFNPLREDVVRALRGRGFTVEFMAGGNDACHVVRW